MGLTMLGEEFEIDIEKLKIFSAERTDQILVEFKKQQLAVRHIIRSTNLLSVFRTRMNCQSSGRNLTAGQLAYWKGGKTD
jgi:hypothetical protein